jgi:hypothetical protein
MCLFLGLISPNYPTKSGFLQISALAHCNLGKFGVQSQVGNGGCSPQMGAARLDQPAATIEWNLGANRQDSFHLYH